MESYLIEELTVNEKGIYFPDGSLIPWSTFYKNNYYFRFKEDALGFNKEIEDSLDVYWYPFIIYFYWVEIIPYNEDMNSIRIHFPKGQDQQNEFKSLAAYYILKEVKMLNMLASNNNDEANNLILKIFK